MRAPSGWPRLRPAWRRGRRVGRSVEARSGDRGKRAIADADRKPLPRRHLRHAGDERAIRLAAHHRIAAPKRQQWAERVQTQGSAAQMLTLQIERRLQTQREGVQRIIHMLPRIVDAAPGIGAVEPVCLRVEVGALGLHAHFNEGAQPLARLI